MKAIYWIRNDLRLHDNAALASFCEQASEGCVVWCPSASFHRAGDRRKSFILQSAQEFARKLGAKGLPVLLANKSASDLLPELATQLEIERIFVTAECAPEERAEEAAVAKHKENFLARVEQSTLLRSEDLPFSILQTPEVFTQFRLQVEKSLHVRNPLAAPKHWPKAIKIPSIESIVSSSLAAPHPRIAAGESAGLARLAEYIWERDRLRVYKETRNGMLHWDDSSKFSPWLSVGALSPREIYREIQGYESERCKNESTYWLFFELLWRDYFRFILEKKQVTVFGRRPSLDERSATALARWCKAETGDDFIDANMAELNSTGWLSNRGRQNVASYLAKEVNVPWQYGAEHFERMLIDYDVASNWGNWAYLAGTGQDPRNRRFNSARQAEIYDPDREYRSKWLAR